MPSPHQDLNCTAAMHAAGAAHASFGLWSNANRLHALRALPPEMRTRGARSELSTKSCGAKSSGGSPTAATPMLTVTVGFGRRSVAPSPKRRISRAIGSDFDDRCRSWSGTISAIDRPNRSRHGIARLEIVTVVASRPTIRCPLADRARQNRAR